MKNIIVIVFLLIGATAIMAQTPAAKTEAKAEKKNLIAPPAVQKAFEQKFPKATKVKWGMEDATEWEAEFTLNEGKLSANFTADGTWVETEKEINVSEFPKAVTDALNAKYKGWVIKEAAKTETAKHGTIYEADLKKEKDKKAVAFKADGTEVAE